MCLDIGTKGMRVLIISLTRSVKLSVKASLVEEESLDLFNALELRRSTPTFAFFAPLSFKALSRDPPASANAELKATGNSGAADSGGILPKVANSVAKELIPLSKLASVVRGVKFFIISPTCSVGEDSFNLKVANSVAKELTPLSKLDIVVVRVPIC